MWGLRRAGESWRESLVASRAGTPSGDKEGLPSGASPVSIHPCRAETPISVLFSGSPPLGLWDLEASPPLPTSLTQSLECSRTKLVLSLRRERGTDSPGREFISSPETLNRLSPGLGLSFPAGVTGRCSGRATVLTAERGDSSGPEGPEERPGVLLPQVSAWPPLGSPVSQPQLQLAWQWG